MKPMRPLWIAAIVIAPSLVAAQTPAVSPTPMPAPTAVAPPAHPIEPQDADDEADEDAPPAPQPRRHVAVAPTTVHDANAVVAPAPDPRTIRSPWTIAVDTQITWMLDPRTDTFNRNAPVTAGPGLSISRDVVGIGRNGGLQVGLMYQHWATDGLVAQTVDTHLDTHQFGVDGTLRIPWLTWLTPHARLAANAVYYDARVAASTGHPLTGGGWSALGSLGVGLTLHTPAGLITSAPRVLFGLRVEGGYTLGTPASIDVSAPPPSSSTAASDRIETQPTHLGTFIPHGPYLRISVVVRF